MRQPGRSMYADLDKCMCSGVLDNLLDKKNFVQSLLTS